MKKMWMISYDEARRLFGSEGGEYRGEDWNAEQRRRAHKQGWFIAWNGHILSQPSYARTFVARHGMEPLEFVKHCAAHGSSLHQHALAVAIKRRITS